MPEADVSTTSASGTLTAEEWRERENALTTRIGELVSLVAGLKGRIAELEAKLAKKK